MSYDLPNTKRTRHSAIKVIAFFLLIAFVLPALACSYGKEEPAWVPENPKQYTAETTPVDVYVLVDSSGNVVDFDEPYAYGTTAKLTYVLRFWDAGILLPGYEKATISRVYTPFRISAIKQEIEAGLSEAEKAEIYARTSFPSTEVPLHELTFNGVTDGHFYGTNSETGNQIIGFLKWEDNERQMGAVHVIFTEDIQQDYVVLGEEVFFNWP